MGRRQDVLKRIMEKYVYPDAAEKDSKLRQYFITLQAELLVSHRCLDGLVTRFEGERALTLFERLELLKRKLQLPSEINELSIQDTPKELN